MTITEDAKEFVKDKEEITYLFNKHVEYVDPDDIHEAVCKLVEIREGQTQTGQYYIRVGYGDIYDPYGTSTIRRSNVTLFPFKKVNKVVFDNYIQYLKQRKTKFLTQARRDFITLGVH